MFLWVQVQYNLNYWKGGKIRWTLSGNWILHLFLSSIIPLYSLAHPGTPRMGHLSVSSMFRERGECEHQSWRWPLCCSVWAEVRSWHSYVVMWADTLLWCWILHPGKGMELWQAPRIGIYLPGGRRRFSLILRVAYATLVERSLQGMFETQPTLIL